MAGEEWREPSVTDQDRLPWLETAEDESEGAQVSRIVGAVLVGLAAIAAILAAVYWFQHRAPAPGDGRLIAAEQGDYKIKPQDPGGMKVDGEGDAAVATSGGAKAGSGKIAVGDLPETPVTGRKVADPAAKPTTGTTVTATASAPTAKLTAPAPGKPVTIASGGGAGAVVQLGAFPSEAAANSAWTARSKRFDYLAALGKSVQKAEVNGRTFYRLRVNAGSAGAAQDLCNKLKVAGEGCLVTN